MLKHSKQTYQREQISTNHIDIFVGVLNIFNHSECILA